MKNFVLTNSRVIIDPSTSSFSGNIVEGSLLITGVSNLLFENKKSNDTVEGYNIYY